MEQHPIGSAHCSWPRALGFWAESMEQALPASNGPRLSRACERYFPWPLLDRGLPAPGGRGSWPGVALDPGETSLSLTKRLSALACLLHAGVPERALAPPPVSAATVCSIAISDRPAL